MTSYEFKWNKESIVRNDLTFRYEPLQPPLLIALSETLCTTIFFDVGANIGFYSLALSLVPSIDTIYSFEACDETFDHLKANIEINGMNGVVIPVKKAVSNKDGLINFQSESALSGRNSVVETSVHRKDLFVSVKEVTCCSLDSFASDIVNKIITMKVDVEGHEHQVLSGAINLLTNNECIIQVENYEDKDNATITLLNQLGYRRIFKIKNDFYYSNAECFKDTAIVLASVENASEKFINLSLGDWPLPRPTKPTALNKKEACSTISRTSPSIPYEELIELMRSCSMYPLTKKGIRVANQLHTTTIVKGLLLNPDSTTNKMLLAFRVAEGGVAPKGFAWSETGKFYYRYINTSWDNPKFEEVIDVPERGVVKEINILPWHPSTTIFYGHITLS